MSDQENRKTSAAISREEIRAIPRFKNLEDLEIDEIINSIQVFSVLTYRNYLNSLPAENE